MKTVADGPVRVAADLRVGADLRLGPARRLHRSACARTALMALALLQATTTAFAESIQGRWKLIAAEDLRADGSVARYPWGRHPVGSIVVNGAACYLQIMSSDTPAFAGDTPATEQMKAMLLSSYIAYSGACAIDEAAGKVTLKVDAAWRPDYVGTSRCGSSGSTTGN